MNIAIITGGTDQERFVSIKSAENIRKNLVEHTSKIFLYPEDWMSFEKEAKDFDVVIPIIHGESGEDGLISGKIKDLNIQYIFSHSQNHLACFNKKNAKEKIPSSFIKIPKTYSRLDIEQGDASFPLIAKPVCGGSSIGLYIIENKDDFLALDFKKDYLFEEYILGREFTVGVIDYNSSLQALPVMEAKKNSLVFDFDQKYSEQSKEIEVFPENLDSDLTFRLQEAALFIHDLFGLTDVSRSDFLVDKHNQIYFLEVNTIPGMTSTSWIPKMLAKAEIDFSKLFDYWIKKALK